jgi:uncharacterized membrane protein YdjX (TVP38/TMEM64 family)
MDTDLQPATPFSTEPEPVPAERPWLRPVLLIVILLVAVIAARTLGLGGRLDEIRSWILGFGPLGPAVFVAVYASAVVVAIPASVLTIAAGAMFGSVQGVVLVSIASTLGAALAFSVARWFARPSVSRWLENNPRFRTLDGMTREHGAAVVAVTRLVPIFPYTLLNFGFGLTGVRFSTYVLWSWLGMIPGTILYVVGADAVTTGLAEGRVPWPLVAVVVVVAAALSIIARRARRALETKPIDHQQDGGCDERAA